MSPYLDNALRIEQGALKFRGKPIPEGDAATYDPMTDVDYFSKDANCVYWSSSSREGWGHVPDADAARFVACGDHLPYGTDLDCVFGCDSHQAKPEPRAQGNSTAPLEVSRDILAYLRKHQPQTVGWWHPDYPYAYRIRERDGLGFVITDRAVHFVGTDFDISATTLPYPNRPDSADRPLCSMLVRGAQPASFTPLDYLHGRDGAQLYFRWNRIAGADAKTFTVLGYGFARDAHRVYYGGLPLENADLASFELIPPKDHPLYLDNGGFARDKQGVYIPKLIRLPHQDYRWSVTLRQPKKKASA